MVPNSNGRKPLTTTTATLRSMVTRSAGAYPVTNGHDCSMHQALAGCPPSMALLPLAGYRGTGHSVGMDAYSSSPLSQRASWVSSLARRVCHAVSEFHQANKVASSLML